MVWRILASNLFTYININIAQLVKNLSAMQETRFDSRVRKICWRRDRPPTPVSLGFPCGSAGKEFACKVGDLGSILGLGRSPGEGKGYPLQYSGLENSMDSRAHGVANSWTQLSDFHFHKFYTWIYICNKYLLCGCIKFRHSILDIQKLTWYHFILEKVKRKQNWTCFRF